MAICSLQTVHSLDNFFTIYSFIGYLFFILFIHWLISLQAFHTLAVISLQAVQSGPESMQSMYPDIFDQLLTFVEFGVRVPKFGQLEAKAFGAVKGPQVCVSPHRAILLVITGTL